MVTQTQADTISTLDHIKSMLKANIPYIWVNTYEEDRFIETLYGEILIPLNRETLTWSAHQGLVPYDPELPYTRAKGEMEQTTHPQRALDAISDHETSKNFKGTVFVMKDFHTVLQQPIPRQMRDLYVKLSNQKKCMIFVSPMLAHGPMGQKGGIEPTLEKQITVLSYELPTKAFIESRIVKMLSHLKTQIKGNVKSKIDYTSEEINQFAIALQGLTEQEIAQAMATSMTHLKELNHRFLLSQKRQIIQRSEILEYIGVTPSINDVGGLDLAKKYFETYKDQFTPEAEAFGVDPLKGVLLTGLPGAGKSLLVKAVASVWHLPLLRLDVGKVMGSLVGSSEERMRQVISQVESIAPCILWIDEIEKSLSGTKSSNQSVSGYETIWIKVNGRLEYTNLRGLHRLWLFTDNKIEALALNPETFKLEWKQVVRSIEHTTNDPLMKVKTSSGREIIATQSHSFVTLDENGKLVKIETKDLLGKLIPFAKNIHLEPQYTEIDLSIYNSPKTHHKMGKVSLDRNFGRLLGLWLAEGSINGDSVQIACSESSIVNFVLDTIRQIWPNKHTAHSYGSIQISSRPFSDWMRENFVLGAIEKQVPEVLLETPKEFRLGLIEGALSGDGSACFTNSGSMDLSLSSSSINLLKGYLMILNSLGVRATIIMPRTYPSSLINAAPNGSINICNLDYGIFNLISYQKQEKIAAYRSGSCQIHRPTDRIPLPKNIIQQLGLDKNNTKQEILRTKAYRGRLSAEKTLEYLESVPNSLAKQKIIDLATADVRWDIVNSIETIPSEETVYDLEIEDSHTFTLASGTVVHNSDGGTMARVFGTLLTAMEERMKDTVVLATANDIQALPPELIRRFNEIFFVDLPRPPEREEIFKIHLRKRKRDIERLNLNVDELVTLTHLYTGSEIEKSVKEGIARAFQNKRKDVIQEDLVGAIKSTKPIAKVMSEQINAIREWAREKARYASSLAAAAAAPSAQVVTTSGGTELDLNSDLDDLDEAILTKREQEKKAAQPRELELEE